MFYKDIVDAAVIFVMEEMSSLTQKLVYWGWRLSLQYQIFSLPNDME